MDNELSLGQELVPLYSPLLNTPDTYEAAVEEGKRLVKQREDDRMRLGALADQVTKAYGEDTLAKFAKDIGVNKSSLNTYRATFRAWHGKNQAPDNFAAMQELAAVPEREEILQKEPDMPQRKARGIAKKAKPPFKALSERRSFRKMPKKTDAQLTVDKLEPEVDSELELFARTLSERFKEEERPQLLTWLETFSNTATAEAIRKLWN